MFPFLTPIKQPNHIERIESKVCFVEMTFLAASPFGSRANSSASTRFPSALCSEQSSSESKITEGFKAIQTTSRPSSRQKSKTAMSTQPTAVRSDKSSPVPVKECVPQFTRHKNKGLEMSPAMMELFGASNKQVCPFSSGSKAKEPSDESCTNKYEHIAFKTVRNSELSQPGPEWFEGFEKLEVIGAEVPIINIFTETYPRLNDGINVSEHTDSVEPEYHERITKPLKRQNRNLNIAAESLPGPDIGVEIEEDIDVCNVVSLTDETHDVAVDSPTKDCSDEQKGGSDKLPSTTKNGGESADCERHGSTKDAEDTRNDATHEKKENDASKNGGGGVMSSILIKSAQIINDDSIFISDVLIEDGVIKNIGCNLEVPSTAEVIDANGKMLIPAGIDVHTEITSPESCDDIVTGSKSALAGGTATIIEVISPNLGESPFSAFKRVRNCFDKALCNVAASVLINSWSEQIKTDMEKLVLEGVNNFVINVDDDQKLFQLFEHCRKIGAYARVVPENHSIVSILEKKMLALGINGPEGYPQSRPEILEFDRVNKVCVLSQLSNCPISIISLSSQESLEAIEKARSLGTLAHAEIASAAVATDGSQYMSKDWKQAVAHLTQVPLRKGASDRLISALASQPLVICSSGHKAINVTSRPACKNFISMPKGSVGAEERMVVVWEKAVRTGKIDPMRFVAITSSNAAKVFNMYPKKGRIAVGADADLVIWDGTVKKTISSSISQSSVDYSLYEGFTVHCSVFATIINGIVAYKDETIKSSGISGGFLSLSANSPFLFSVVNQRDKFSAVERVDREINDEKQQTNGNTPKVNEFDRELMHFVKKVPTSEEERELKRKENEKRSKQFLNVRNKIVEKRENVEYDDEMLSLTQSALEKNADIYTFWNIRRITILKRLEANEIVQKSNPKSYSSWYHRAWVLERQSCPDFSKELALYNFSNYSAWHYRSISLKKLYSETTGQFTLDQEIIGKELQKVKFAFYMDADDQSAWMYTRWLLEAGSGKQFLRPDTYIPIELVSASFHGTNTTLVFTRAISIDYLLSFVNTEDRTRWRGFSSTSPCPKSSKVWQYLSDAPLRIITSLSSETLKYIDISEKKFVNTKLIRKIYGTCSIELPSLISELLADCSKLISLEPNNKWPLYMQTLILIEYQPNSEFNTIINNLKKLETELDTKRSKLYRNLASRQCLNAAIRENDLLEKLLRGETDYVKVANCKLNSLEGIEYLSGLIGQADFSGNEIHDIRRIVLPNAYHINLNENPIKKLLPNASLSHLKFISVASTEIANVEDVMPLLQVTPSLEKFIFCETLLVDQRVDLAEQLPGVRLIPYWL
ncbi:unnamed protein product [Caenorhabditis bovis]|uniref:Amidohydrolase-related domain-containing protein n=1 Tax=Caenorhabditis bovis TaxID=2654633 RepID=A0A8S1F5K3_9PELO|nr:unnamed protein product [Caenorhabditis bovis]